MFCISFKGPRRADDCCHASLVWDVEASHWRCVVMFVLKGGAQLSRHLITGNYDWLHFGLKICDIWLMVCLVYFLYLLKQISVGEDSESLSVNSLELPR